VPIKCHLPVPGGPGFGCCCFFLGGQGSGFTAYSAGTSSLSIASLGGADAVPYSSCSRQDWVVTWSHKSKRIERKRRTSSSDAVPSLDGGWDELAGGVRDGTAASGVGGGREGGPEDDPAAGREGADDEEDRLGRLGGARDGLPPEAGWCSGFEEAPARNEGDEEEEEEEECEMVLVGEAAGLCGLKGRELERRCAEGEDGAPESSFSRGEGLPSTGKTMRGIGVALRTPAGSSLRSCCCCLASA
jgi:hypothetical protein